MHVSIHLMEVRAQCALFGIGLRIGTPFLLVRLANECNPYLSTITLPAAQLSTLQETCL